MTWSSLGRVAAVALVVGVAAVGGFVWGERRATRPAADGRPPLVTSAPASMPPAPASSTEESMEVSLTPEAIGRAGIKTAIVRSQATTASITVPGTVTSNAYRDTRAAALVGGIVRNVNVELGSMVSRGQALAVIVSTELAAAPMKYLSARAMLAAEHQKLTRTEKLVTLAPPAARSWRRSPRCIVPAPGARTVVARAVNPGQVVSAGQELFVVADLSTVWVIGDLYEKDFASVRTGAVAIVSVPALPPIRGRVAYIDPRVDPAARTAKVRVEVANPAGALRLGMFVSVTFTLPATAGAVAVVPRAAIQAIGSRSVVYVAADGDEGRFIERAVTVGAPVGDAVEVIEGLKPGERVVREGSFFLRAEAARTR
jgi:multidrug efflux pump subunit AcrA (membrane-fusion protein)